MHASTLALPSGASVVPGETSSAGMQFAASILVEEYTFYNLTLSKYKLHCSTRYDPSDIYQ